MASIVLGSLGHRCPTWLHGQLLLSLPREALTTPAADRAAWPHSAALATCLVFAQVVCCTGFSEPALPGLFDGGCPAWCELHGCIACLTLPCPATCALSCSISALQHAHIGAE